MCTDGCPGPACGGEDSAFLAWQTVQDSVGSTRQPYGPWPGLAVRQKQLAFPHMVPLERCDFASAATGVQQQRDGTHLQWTRAFESSENRTDTCEFLSRQESLATSASIALDSPARITLVGPITVDLRLSHNHRQDGKRAVCRHRSEMEGIEPMPYLLDGIFRDGTAFEVGQNLLAQVFVG